MGKVPRGDEENAAATTVKGETWSQPLMTKHDEGQRR